MRAILSNLALSNVTPEVRLEHNNEILSFSISVFNKKSFQGPYDVFAEINEYWSYLPIDIQNRVFNIYKEIQQSYDDLSLGTDLTTYIGDKVAELISYHSLTNLYDWMMFRSNIRIPDGFEQDYEHSLDNNTSREKTYTKSDYVQLLTLSLCLRCMIPVWGEYISITRQEKGTIFKEFYAFRLLTQSDLINSVPMEKLRVYIDHIVGANRFKPDNTLRSISSEDFIFWLLSLVCVKKLCVADIRGIDPEVNIIKFLYKYIKQKVDNDDSNFEQRYKEKTIEDKGSNQENKISILERYKIKSNIAPGEIVELEYSLRNIENVVSKLTSQIDKTILYRSLDTAQQLLDMKIQDPQMTLLRWVFKPVISPRGLMYLSKQTIVNALGILEAVLIARGHKYLAVLSTSYSMSSDKELIISPVDSKTRVDKELVDLIEKYYPLTKQTGNKKNTSSITPVKKVNLAMESIDKLADELMMFSWKPTADDSLLMEVFGTNVRRSPIRPDIKNHLSRLVIEIGSRSSI